MLDISQQKNEIIQSYIQKADSYILWEVCFSHRLDNEDDSVIAYNAKSNITERSDFYCSKVWQESIDKIILNKVNKAVEEDPENTKGIYEQIKDIYLKTMNQTSLYMIMNWENAINAVYDDDFSEETSVKLNDIVVLGKLNADAPNKFDYIWDEFFIDDDLINNIWKLGAEEVDNWKSCLYIKKSYNKQKEPVSNISFNSDIFYKVVKPTLNQIKEYFIGACNAALEGRNIESSIQEDKTLSYILEPNSDDIEVSSEARCREELNKFKSRIESILSEFKQEIDKSIITAENKCIELISIYKSKNDIKNEFDRTLNKCKEEINNAENKAKEIVLGYVGLTNDYMAKTVQIKKDNLEKKLYDSQKIILNKIQIEFNKAIKSMELACTNIRTGGQALIKAFNILTKKLINRCIKIIESWKSECELEVQNFINEMYIDQIKERTAKINEQYQKAYKAIMDETNNKKAKAEALMQSKLELAQGKIEALI